MHCMSAIGCLFGERVGDTTLCVDFIEWLLARYTEVCMSMDAGTMSVTLLVLLLIASHPASKKIY